MDPAARLAAAMREDRWDAIVIGAGPAGALASRQLGLLGWRVLLVEKARLPRDKVCGGCLGGAALDVLASVGLDGIPQACGGVPLKTLALASGGAIARIPIGRRVAISRRTFDEALVQAAIRAGVVVCDQTLGALPAATNGDVRVVTLRHFGQEYTVRGKVAIVATGLARCPPGCTAHNSPGSPIGLGAMLEQAPCDVMPNILHMACASSGYVGITAVEGGRYDIAAAVDPSVLAAAESAGQLVHDIMKHSGFTPTIDLRDVEWRGTPLLTRRTFPLATHRCLLIGDAAGYVEPFTGEGIGWAMQSAVLAAALLAGSLEHWDESIVARWQRIYDHALAGRQRSCRALSRVLRVQSLRQLMTWGLRRAPSLSRPIVKRLDRPFVTPVF